MTPSRLPPALEDTVRREALRRYLEGNEEQALDFLGGGAGDRGADGA